MKNIILGIIAYGPVIGYVFYARINSDPNNGFDWVELVIVITLGLTGSLISKYLKSKWKE